MVGGVAWEQRALWLGFLVSAAVVLYGSCLNSAGLKYSRVSAGYGPDASLPTTKCRYPKKVIPDCRNRGCTPKTLPSWTPP